MKKRGKISKAFTLFQKGGWKKFKSRLERKKLLLEERRSYQKWIAETAAFDDRAREEMRRKIDSFSRKPLISVILPVYNTKEKWLRLALDSVLCQVYENWQLCIADDRSSKPHVRAVLEEYAAKDERIKIVFRAENGHISAASNSALALAKGEFCALLDHDDELSEDALFYVAKEINDFPDVAFLYTDEDMIGENGERFALKFKPDFSLDFLYSVNYLTHLAVYRTEILREIGGFRKGFEGSQDYDLALRFIERIDETRIRHIPKILYHWRAIEGSVALDAQEKPYAHERARRAISEHLQRLVKKASVSRAIYEFHRVSYDLPEILPTVSLIILADNNRRTVNQTIRTFTENTDYDNFEIIFADSGKTENPLENRTFPPHVRVFPAGEKERADVLNFSAEKASGEILCFVDANLKPLSGDWLKELVLLAMQKEIGAVGAKILSADEKIIGGGLIVGTKEAVSAAHYDLPREAEGNLFRAQLINNFSAVSVSCFTVRRSIFAENKGFDAQNFPDKFYDADFCLRLREKNYRVVFTPYAELIQIKRQKSLSERKKTSEFESKFFRQKWRKYVENDPFYNSNFSYENGNFSIKREEK
jgi:glycosyltransferase involved in cell wall biosynthesis